MFLWICSGFVALCRRNRGPKAQDRHPRLGQQGCCWSLENAGVQVIYERVTLDQLLVGETNIVSSRSLFPQPVPIEISECFIRLACDMRPQRLTQLIVYFVRIAPGCDVGRYYANAIRGAKIEARAPVRKGKPNKRFAAHQSVMVNKLHNIFWRATEVTAYFLPFTGSACAF